MTRQKLAKINAYSNMKIPSNASGEMKRTIISPTTLNRLGAFVQNNMTVFAHIPGAYIMLKLANKLLMPPLRSKSNKSQSRGVSIDAGGIRADWLIVVPQSMHPDRVAWAPAEGNYFFDIWQSAIEAFPLERVELHFIQPRDLNWIENLEEKVKKHNPVNILMQGEEQPNSDSKALEKLFLKISGTLTSRIVLVLYDSVYWWHTIQFDRYAAIYDNIAVVAIDAFPKRIKKAQFRIGPVVLPTSKKSITKIRESLDSGSIEKYGLTFIGAIYPYRRAALQKLRNSRIDLTINPHKDVQGNVKPSYLEYCQAFANSWATLNLSRSNGMPEKHIKTRILEAPLFGTLLITDQKNIPESLMSPKAYVSYRNRGELRRKIAELRENIELYEDIKNAGALEAESLRTLFWTLIKKQT